jgi:hypothetical protein
LRLDDFDQKILEFKIWIMIPLHAMAQVDALVMNGEHRNNSTNDNLEP